MKIMNCPICGKEPKIRFDEPAYNAGWGAWYTIQCKPFLGKTHLKIEEGKASREYCLLYAINHWNDKVAEIRRTKDASDRTKIQC